MDLLNTQNGVGPYYANTLEFVQALSNNMKIATICPAEHLDECMSYNKIVKRDGTIKNIND